ncbi:MAG: nicotinate phosphoribosyltransferase [Peptococcaceae bacterium]|nr:nicotinate phosphoribosyltransferase [Peptococcaceae bacterium]
MHTTNPLLWLDFYKTTHAEQYPKGLTKIVSYFTPRLSRLDGENHLVMFGLQGTLKTYLLKAFQENFFNRSLDEVMAEYTRILDNTLGQGIVNYDKIRRLHTLGYLPIQIKALDEGLRVPMKVPMLEVTNTHPDFAWLVNTLETALSCSLWHPMISANVGYMYRKIVNKYFDISVEDNIPRRRALGDFSMRGQESLDSAAVSSAAFCLSFVNTATVPAILYLEDNYNCDCAQEEVAFGAISTEHSVMTSNFAVDGDEITMLKRLLTETYPNNGFSMVSDSYDYWNLVDTLLPQCREEILNHNGYLAIRGDSGNPVDISTQTVSRLWDTFGGHVNTKGFKVLDPHVKVIYGDSITPQRAERIYQKLVETGFACNNVILGVGSFSMQCLEQGSQLQPYTRDTFGIAIKTTYGEINGQPLMIYKDPKTDSGNFKKSQKGCCVVTWGYANNSNNNDDSRSSGSGSNGSNGGNRELTYTDGLTFAEAESHPENLLKTVFQDGTLTREQTLGQIRQRLHGEQF